MKREESHQTEICEHEYPAEERRPREQEVKDEEDSEDETGLPGMKPRDTNISFQRNVVLRLEISSWGSLAFSPRRKRNKQIRIQRCIRRIIQYTDSKQVSISDAHSPNIITLLLQNQEYNGTKRRKPNVR
jgi:hypothetical protein